MSFAVLWFAPFVAMVGGVLLGWHDLSMAGVGATVWMAVAGGSGLLAPSKSDDSVSDTVSNPTDEAPDRA